MGVNKSHPQVGYREVVPLDEGALLINDFVDTEVGVEVRLDVLENGDGTVSTAATVTKLADDSP